MKRPLNVLSLQPYFGGSHVQFQKGWESNSIHSWTTLSLPARHWKWRMRHASIYFAEQLRGLVADGQFWDVIMCTDMLNVAEFKGLIGPELASLPIVLYFHENQFEYPNRVGFKRDEHFPFTNFTSALAADKIWFNSRFNFDSMLDGLARQAKRWPDYKPLEAIASLESKMDVQSPGIETPPIDVHSFLEKRIERAKNREPIHLVWAARWEHDKNAEDLLAALKILSQDDVSFQISVLGQSFRYSPAVFEDIQSAFSDRIRRWGYQESRQEFWEALGEADVFISTAKHEFFGLAAAEAIASGLLPLFPNRLAYPELLDLATDTVDVTNYLYDGTARDLADSLTSIHSKRLAGEIKADVGLAEKLLDNVGWDRRAAEMDAALCVIAE